MNLKIKLYVKSYSTINTINPRIIEIIDSIKNTDKFQIALTHKSYVKKKDNKKSYETLEFIGDSILQIYVSVIIHNIFPDYNEGQLTQLRSSLVNTKNLSKITLKTGLHNYLKINRSVDFNKKTLTKPNAKILADIYESFLTALYLIKGKNVLLEFITLTLFDDPKFKDDLKLLNPNMIPNLPLFNDKIGELKSNPDILKEIKEQFNILESSISKQIQSIDNQHIPSNNISDNLIKEEFNRLESSLINQMRGINHFLSKEFNNLNLSLDEVQSVNLLFLELVNSLKKKPIDKDYFKDIKPGGNLNQFNKENLVLNSLDKIIITNNNNGYIQEGSENVNNIIASNLLSEINNKFLIHKPNLNNNLDHISNSEKEIDINEFTLNNMKNGAIIVIKLLFSLILFSSLFFLDESILQMVKKLTNEILKIDIGNNKLENISELPKIIENNQIEEQIKDDVRSLYVIPETNSYIENLDKPSDSLFLNYILLSVIYALGFSFILFIGSHISNINSNTTNNSDTLIEITERSVNNDFITNILDKSKILFEKSIDKLNDLSDKDAFPILYAHLLALIAYLWDDLEEPLNSSNISEPLFIPESNNDNSLGPISFNTEISNNEDLIENNTQIITITEETVEEYEQIEQFTQTDPILDDITNVNSNPDYSLLDLESIINNQNSLIEQAENTILELNEGLNEAKESIIYRDNIIENLNTMKDELNTLKDKYSKLEHNNNIQKQIDSVKNEIIHDAEKFLNYQNDIIHERNIKIATVSKNLAEVQDKFDNKELILPKFIKAKLDILEDYYESSDIKTIPDEFKEIIKYKDTDTGTDIDTNKE